MTFRFVLPILIMCLLLPLVGSAQHLSTSNPYAARLYNGKWKLTQIQTHDGLVVQSPAVEFRLEVTPDGVLKQGLYPEGMVASQWRFDPVRMELYVSDETYQSSFIMRVLTMRKNALVLESYDSGEHTLLYYETMNK